MVGSDGEERKFGVTRRKSRSLKGTTKGELSETCTSWDGIRDSKRKKEMYLVLPVKIQIN